MKRRAFLARQAYPRSGWDEGAGIRLREDPTAIALLPPVTQPRDVALYIIFVVVAVVVVAATTAAVIVEL